MREDIKERVIAEAVYILETKSTVRKTAKVFNVGKSTVHKDVTVHLKYIDKTLCEKIGEILEINLKERHIRGGEATKQKYLREKRGL